MVGTLPRPGVRVEHDRVPGRHHADDVAHDGRDRVGARDDGAD